MVAAQFDSANDDEADDSPFTMQGGAFFVEFSIIVFSLFKTIHPIPYLTGVLDVPSAAYAFGFAIARGRPRAMPPSFFMLWLILRLAFGPTTLNELIPGVAFFALLLPVLVLVLPSKRSHRHALLALALMLAAAVVQTPLRGSTTTHTSIVMDLLFTIPLSLHADAVLAGWLLGCSTPFRIGKPFLRFLVVSATLATTISASIMLYRSSFAPVVREAALLPLLAALLLASYTVPTKIHPSIIRIMYAALLVAAPLQSAITTNACAPRSPHIRLQQFFCKPSEKCADSTPRILSEFWHCNEKSVRLIVFVPVLLTIGTLFYCLFQQPVERCFQALLDRNLNWPMTFTEPSSDADATGIDSNSESKPMRFSSTFVRALRVLAYFLALGTFLVCFLQFSIPVSFGLARTIRNPLFCTLPSSVYHCRVDSYDGKMGIMQRVGETTWFRVLLYICRAISLLSFPTLVINLIGHVVFPRANWKPIPPTQYLLQNARVVFVPKSSEEDRLLRAWNNAPLPISKTRPIPNGLSANSKPTANPDVELSNTLLPLDLDIVLYFRYVTRGMSPNLVHRNCRRAVAVLQASGLPDAMWCVEVVTDNPLNLAELGEKSVHELLVPSSYSPPRGAMYKARALNYAIKHSKARDLDWIVHLDEETCFDTDTVAAIVEHCGRETYRVRVAQVSKWPRIGQGAIVYGRAMLPTLARGCKNTQQNWVTTLADSNRVADDCGRFRFQYELGEVWIGMHGSYVVAANSVERAVTFDHGLAGSIAEDAYFALLARSMGVRFAWIDALMFEQSPFTFRDFIKQRARWLVGGLLVVHNALIPLRIRAIMGTLVTLWSAMPLTYFALFLSVVLGSLETSEGSIQWMYAFMLSISAALSVWSYIFGFWVTFYAQGLGTTRFVALLYLQLLLIPVYGIMEVCGVTYGLLNFRKLSTVFHVVAKDTNITKSQSARNTETTYLLSRN